MKKIICILISVLLNTQALALDSGSFEVRVTINKEPEIQSFQPNDGYTITEGDILEITVVATDPNNDPLQYQFIVNGVVKKTWGNESIFDYILENSDRGLNKIVVEVTDGIDTVQTQEVEIYVFHKSPDLPTG